MSRFHPSRCVVCAHCQRTRSITKAGKVRAHRCPASGKRCNGSGTDEGGHQLAPFYVTNIPASIVPGIDTNKPLDESVNKP